MSGTEKTTVDAPLAQPARHAFIERLAGMRLGGRYVVSRVLGMGGMGVVVAATNEELDQKVAIKLMFPEHAANSVLAARFSREAKLAAKVESPHLVRVFDVGRHESGVPYLVMEMLNGRDLGAELLARGPLPISEAVDILLQAALGVAEIHTLGFVHRDLKPSNLFVAQAAGTTMIKILDFGITKESSPESTKLTTTDSLLGTPSYMSPEQIKSSRDTDLRTDVWSLGVILYELLTGRGPFVLEGDSVGELFASILFSDVTPPRRHRAEISLSLESALLRSLEKDRDARYATVRDFAEALGPHGTIAGKRYLDALRVLTGGPTGGVTGPDARPKDPPNDGPLYEKMSGIGLHPTTHQPAPAVARVAAPTAMPETGKSLATSSRSVTTVDRAPSKTLVLGIVGAIVVVLVAAIALVLQRPARTVDEATTPSTEPSASERVAPASLPAASKAAPAAIEPLVPTSVASTTSTSSSSAAVAPSSAPASRPIVRPAVSSETKSAAPPISSTPASTPGLVLDRK